MTSQTTPPTSTPISRPGGKRAKVTLTITLEYGLIKLMTSQGRAVLDYRLLIANPRFFRESLVSNQLRVASVIQNALQEMDVKPANIIGAVPGFQTTLGVLNLPRSPGLNPNVVVPREASTAMGISQERSQMVWHHLPDQQSQGRWLVASAARRSITSLVQTAAEAGLTVTGMDLRPLALARAVNQANAVIGWVAPDGCDVVIVRDSVPVEYQALFWGADPVDGSVLVSRLTDVLERTTATHDRNSTSGPLSEETPVYVVGSQVAREPEVATQVADNLQRPLGQPDPPLTVPPEFPILDLIVNLGLALREA